MLRSYWKLARRHLVKNRAYTVINVAGLGMALAICIIAYLNYQYDARYDAFHTNRETLYRINSVKEVNGEEEAWGLSPLPLGRALQSDIGGVEQTTRWRFEGSVVRYEDRVFHEYVAFADSAFLEMFTFPLTAGDPDVLRHGDRVLITQEVAVKYFGGDDPVGRPLTLRIGEAAERVFTVGAVAAPYPLNSSIRFDIVAPYDALMDAAGLQEDDWATWGDLTFVRVTDPGRLRAVEAQLQAYVPVQNAARPDWPVVRFYAEPLRLLAPHSRQTRGHVLYNNVPASAVVGGAITAVLVLLMACFNFINLSVVTAGRRMKEIGVRKVMGGRRLQLAGQFLGESLLLCGLALVVAVGLARVLLPLYNALWPDLFLELNFRDNAPLFGFLALLVLATGLLAGTYPAFYASAFQPIEILRGAQRLARPRPFTRVLLGFQFGFTILGVGGSLLFAENARYQERLDMGYARDVLLAVPLDEAATFVPYRDAVTRHPGVEAVAGTDHHIGRSWATATVRQADAEREVDLFDVGDHYVAAAGLRVVRGRDFLPEREADRTASVLVNESLARTFGWDEPVGQVITTDSVRYSVVGVVEDFHTRGVWRPIEPAVLRLTPSDAYHYLVVRARPDQLPEVDAFLEKTWKQIAPESPYEGFYQDEVLAEGVMVSQSIRKEFGFIAFLTLLIAGTGLFALVSLTIARRTKEIGIRKVLGASLLHIGRLIGREFAMLLGVAAVGAAASGYFAVDLLLDAIYTYHVEVGLLPFGLGALLILSLALLAIGSKVYGAATANPVHALRSE